MGTERTPSAMAAPAVTQARLMTWLSPAFPVGGFSYSHGLEWEVEAGTVRDAASLGDWIGDVLMFGTGRTDLIFLAHAWRALAAGDAGRLDEVAELAAAFAASAERRLETLAQGTAFWLAATAVWPAPGLEMLCGPGASGRQMATDAPAAGEDECGSILPSPRVGERGGRRRTSAIGGPPSPSPSPQEGEEPARRVRDGEQIAYPVAVGVVAAAHGLPLAATAQAFCHAFAANLVSAGVRLVPLGQTDGLRVLARLEPILADVAAGALAAHLDEAGGATLAADIASMRHETQYTRLFRS